MLIGSAPPVSNALPGVNDPAPLPVKIWTVPFGWGEVASGGTPGTVNATSCFPSPLKSAIAPAVGMNASPLAVLPSVVNPPAPSPWKVVKLLLEMLLPSAIDDPKLHGTMSGLLSPVHSPTPTHDAL